MTEAQAVALRVAITGAEESINKIKAVKAQLKGLGDSAASGSGAGVKGLRDLRNAAEAMGNAHRSVVGRLKSEWGSLTGTFRSVALGVTAIGGAFYGVLKTVQAFDKAEGFRRALKLNLGDAEGSRVAGAADKLAIDQGVDINGVRRGAAGLVGSGVQNADQTLKAFLALASKGGATSEGTGRGLEQLAQIASQGKLQGDELRQIQENLIPLRKLLMDAGLGGRMGSQSNPITWQEVQTALLKVLDDPQIAAAMKAQASQSSNKWQAAMNRFQLEVIEPMGKNLGPVVSEVSEKVGKWSKALDWKKVSEFVKKVADMAMGAADWVIKNQDLVLNIGKTILALKAFSVALSLIQAGQTLAGAVGGGAGRAAAAAAGGAAAASGAAGQGAAAAAGAAAPSIMRLIGIGIGQALAGGFTASLGAAVVTVLSGAAVGTAAFVLTSKVLADLGYHDWLANKYDEMNADPNNAKGNGRKGNSDPSAARRFAEQSVFEDNAKQGNIDTDKGSAWGGYGKDAMGRPIKYGEGATKAQRRAAASWMLGDALR